MRSSRLLWPVGGPTVTERRLLIKETLCSRSVTWDFRLERAKGIEPS